MRAIRVLSVCVTSAGLWVGLSGCVSQPSAVHRPHDEATRLAALHGVNPPSTFGRAELLATRGFAVSDALGEQLFAPQRPAYAVAVAISSEGGVQTIYRERPVSPDSTPDRGGNGLAGVPVR